MTQIKNFEDLTIWQDSHSLVLEIYRLTRSFPKKELYGVVAQLRRSASSVPANIVEGFYKNTTKELIQFLFTARASAGETIYFLFLSKDLKYISDKAYVHLRGRYEKLMRSINALINSLKKK